MPDTRPGRNPSGAADPTRVKAERILEEEDRRVSEFVHVVRLLADKWGLDVVERIVLQDKRSGRLHR